MQSNTRIWRVVPVKNGVQAPYFFVETTENVLEKAKTQVLKKAKEKSPLLSYGEWNIDIIKTSYRKDFYGRYWKYHQ